MPDRPGYAVIEDRYLVAAALAGSAEAYDELVRRYRGAVILMAWKTLGSREAAQDVAQEAFLAAFQQLRQLKDPRHFGPWLRIIAHNGAQRLSRKESRSQPVAGEQMDLLLSTHACDRIGNPVESLLKKERDSAIRGLVAALPEGVQIVLQLYYTEQWSVAQIAEFLSVTKTTVKWRLHSGRKHVSRELSAMVSDEDGGRTSCIVAQRSNCLNNRGETNHGQE